jgi:hypothetical protein
MVSQGPSTRVVAIRDDEMCASQKKLRRSGRDHGFELSYAQPESWSRV